MIVTADVAVLLNAAVLPAPEQRPTRNQPTSYCCCCCFQHVRCLRLIRHCTSVFAAAAASGYASRLLINVCCLCCLSSWCAIQLKAHLLAAVPQQHCPSSNGSAVLTSAPQPHFCLHGFCCCSAGCRCCCWLLLLAAAAAASRCPSAACTSPTATTLTSTTPAAPR